MTGQGVEVSEVEERLKAELEEWRTDRSQLHQSKVAAARFEVENRNLQREMLSLQVCSFKYRNKKYKFLIIISYNLYAK